MTGGCAMTTDLNLKWEWPADRQPQLKLVMEITSIEEADRGWFGVKKSPSLIEGIPNPITFRGVIVGGTGHFDGKTVSLTLPKLEAESISSGDHVAVGVFENNTCICIKKLQSSDQDLSDWQC
jgi:hypothetical protein